MGLGNISKNSAIDKMKKARLNGYLCDFWIGYENIDADGILDIHKYVMRKHDIN